MTILFRCPKCDRLLSSPEEQAQSKRNCAHCNEIIIVPEEPSATSAKEEAEKPKIKLYYLNENGKDSGPFTLNQLKSMWQIGKITAATFYFSEGMDGWRQLADMIPVLEGETEPRLAVVNTLAQATCDGQRPEPKQVHLFQGEGDAECSNPVVLYVNKDGELLSQDDGGTDRSHYSTAPQSINPPNFGVVMFLTILLPVVGLVAGIVWLSDPKYRGAGGAIIAITIVLGIIWAAVLAAFMH